ncbi:hypothetical protein [Rheinheimera pacifica]|uniref:hypothetical protein n=1 Tax=Rheinheimera pacifica TaxID=173990 RepID=UPI002ED9D420
MNYKDRCINAVKKTKEFGLEIDQSPIPFSKPISNSKRQKILFNSAWALESIGYLTSFDLAQKCIPVHLMLNQFLKKELGVVSYITIGDRFWSNSEIYCEMSYENIQKELNTPQINSPLNAHIWLTLSDGSILDCTSEAHLDVLENRGIHATNQCLTYIEANSKQNVLSGYHRPYLFGSDFLIKTGAAPAVLCKPANL